jgi:Methyltransferase FkbM domain
VSAGRRIGFMKIDVEGAELKVFRGAREVLTTLRPVVLFECTKLGLENFGCAAGDVYQFLTADANYRIYLIKSYLTGGPALSQAEFLASMQYPFQAFNYVAITGMR